MHSMMTITIDHQPTLQEVADILGCDVVVLKDSFGVLLTDPNAGIYTFMIEHKTLDGLVLPSNVKGPFSNPGIATMED